MKRTLLPALLVLPTLLSTQNPPVGDCLGAIPICQQIYSETNSPVGGGDVLEINDDYNCMRVENNSIWYSFTVNNSGDFGFLLTPNVLTDDYDWALFDITSASCDQLFDNPNLIVSCNAAGNAPCQGSTGANGSSTFDNQGFGCNNNPPSTSMGFSPYNALVPVLAGNTYVLCVSNWSGSPNGYTIDFGLSTGIGIFDEIPPFIESIEVPEECFDGEIIVTFSEPIQCSTIAASNFVLQHLTGTYALSLSSSNCDAGGNFAKTFRLQATPGLFGQSNYILQLLPSSAFPVLDLCGNPAAPENLQFNTTFEFDIDLGADLDFCLSQMQTLDVQTPEATYLWQDGSTIGVYSVEMPGTYAVTVNSSCGIASDTVIFIDMGTLPPVDLGADLQLCPGETVLLDATSPGVNYEWQDGSQGPTLSVSTPGTYAVTISSDCEQRSDEVEISYYAPITANLDENSLCLGDSFEWDVNTPDATYLWQDGSMEPTYQVREPGSYALTISTPCETAVLEQEVSLVVQHVGVNLGADTLLCAADSLVFILVNEAASYQWQDGSSDSIFIVKTPGTYSVTATNACGAASDTVLVNFRDALFIDLPSDTFLCPGEHLVFDLSQAEAEQYNWTGNISLPQIEITEPGSYLATVANACESVQHRMQVRWCEQCDIYVPNAFSPNDDGFNDRFQPLSDCPFYEYRFQIYDRWGALVFESETPDRAWDGQILDKPATPGVYVWLAELVVLEEGIARPVRMYGDVALVR